MQLDARENATWKHGESHALHACVRMFTRTHARIHTGLSGQKRKYLLALVFFPARLYPCNYALTHMGLNADLLIHSLIKQLMLRRIVYLCHTVIQHMYARMYACPDTRIHTYTCSLTLIFLHAPAPFYPPLIPTLPLPYPPPPPVNHSRGFLDECNRASRRHGNQQASKQASRKS